MNFKFFFKNKTILFLIVISLFSNIIFSQVFVDTSPGSRTFTVPCDVTSITVEAWGAGGAGGGSSATSVKGGGGGSGGSYASSIISVIPGQIITYNVGAGGAGLYSAGSNGEGSWVLSPTTVFAQGGFGGAAPNGGSVLGGAGSITSSIGSILSPGSNGGNGSGTIGAGGGAGSNPSGGAGGSSRNSEGNGTNGSSPGGGGGGAFITVGTNHSGGNGGDGQVKITYISAFMSYCTPSFNNNVEPITNVKFAGIDNSSTNVLGGPSLENFCISGYVVQGSTTNSISVKGNTDGNYLEYIKVYVDWDQNGIFGNYANEIYSIGSITNSTGLDAIVATGNITVPGTALLGATKMRVMKYYLGSTNSPCFSGSDWGQAEDYIINVTAPPTITSLSSTNGCVGTNITINGTNLLGISGVNVKIGGTLVSSIISNTATQIVAVIGSGTTGVVTVTNSNGTATSSAVFTVNALPVLPIITETTAPTCAVPTGTITITGVAGLTYNLDGGAFSNTLIYSGLIQGSSHLVLAKNASGCISPVANIIVSSLSTNKWTGSWSILPAPTADQNIEFAANYSVATDVVACSCTLTSGTVTIPSGNTLKLGGKLTVSGGSITFENNASLLQTTFAGANSGSITYKRETTINRNTDFTYWSSPVFGQTLYSTSPLTLASQYFSFNATTNSWSRETATTKVMTPGIGYIIRGSETHKFPNPPATDMAIFNGQPNNGNITVPIVFTDPVNGTSNLIGNPYPSAISADKFLAANSAVIDGTLYFWTHNTSIQLASAIVLPATAGTGVYTYTSDDYASYNGVGGVSALKAKSGTSGNNANIPSGNIAAGDSFFTTGIATGNLIFTNDMRMDNSGSTLDNSQFFKTSNTKAKTVSIASAINVIEKDRIWLDLTNDEGAFKQTLVGYVTDATNDYDSRFDGESFDGNDYIDFYSINLDKNLTIQGRTLPFDENDLVPLGFRSSIDGDFTINIDQVDGLLTDQPVFIEDKLTNTITDLKIGNYTFTTVAGTFNDRFVLRYTNKTLSTKDFTSNENKVLVSVKSKQIKVNSFAETIDKVTVYDLLGRQIYQKINVNSDELSIADLVASHQALVVKITLQNGKTVSDKIIY